MCNTKFEKETRSFAYYCPECRKKKNVEKAMKSRKKRIPETQIGVGSGGNQQGENNPCWKGGHSIYRKIYNNKRKSKTCCELCGSTKFTVVHHKDGDRKNCKPSNLIRVCRSCHSKLHDLKRNFKLCRSKTHSKR